MGTREGGKSSKYTVILYTTEGVIFPVSAKSVRIDFPSPEFSISPQSFTTEISDGFLDGATNPESKATALNSIYVDLNQADLTSEVISFSVIGIVNTIFRSVRNKFQVRFVSEFFIFALI